MFKKMQTEIDRAETWLSAMFVAGLRSFESTATDCTWFCTCFMSVWIRHYNKGLINCGQIQLKGRENEKCHSAVASNSLLLSCS